MSQKEIESSIAGAADKKLDPIFAASLAPFL